MHVRQRESGAWGGSRSLPQRRAAATAATGGPAARPTSTLRMTYKTRYVCHITSPHQRSERRADNDHALLIIAAILL
jgi:hypothetical protein